MVSTTPWDFNWVSPAKNTSAAIMKGAPPIPAKPLRKPMSTPMSRMSMSVSIPTSITECGIYPKREKYFFLF